MRGTASNDGTGKLDAIVFRAGTASAFYVSEHATSLARGRDIRTCLDNLAKQVRDDIENGVYPPEGREILHTFVTSVEVPLSLRDGRRRQAFVCRVDETVDSRGRVGFEAQCPTNYLCESGRSIADAAARLGDVIATRYEAESASDLLRELPKKPMLATIDMRKVPEIRQVSACITREPHWFEARSMESSDHARGSDPLAALRNLEASLSETDLSRAPIMKSEPVYCTLDVPLQLKENTVPRRFFVSVSRYNGTSLPFYSAFVPQAGLALRAKTFEGALDAARDALTLEYREKASSEVAAALKKPVMLTAARVHVN